MNEIIFVFLLIFILSFHFLHIVEVLYYFQLEGYEFKKLYANLYSHLIKNYLVYIALFLIVIFVHLFGFDEFYLNIIFIFASIVFMFFYLKNYHYFKKIKFTKRLIRIFALSILFIFLMHYFLYKFVYRFSLYKIFVFIFIIDFVIISISFLILYPLDKLVGIYYITKAKKKLYKNNSMIKVGITGSFGKTSTKQILNSILSENFISFATPKSYNTPLGISKCINSELNNSHEIFICEMGAKKCGEIKYLCNMIKPQYGIVTSVGRQHTNTFGSIDNIYKTKKELPDYSSCKSCAFNLMNRYVCKMFNEYKFNKIGVFVCCKYSKHLSPVVKSIICIYKKHYSLTKKFYEFPRLNTLCAKNIVSTSEGSTFDVYYNSKFLLSAKTILLGVHNIVNILLAISIAVFLNVGKDNIIKGILSIKSINARMEKFINSNGAVIINNGYNSNIDSVDYSLKTLSLFDCTHKVVITPGVIDSENDFLYNVMFGEKLAKSCTEIIIVKQKNREALSLGLSESGFDMNKVFYVDNFGDTEDFLNKADNSYVILIENDLPDNFK